MIERGSGYIEEGESKRIKILEPFASKLFEETVREVSETSIEEMIDNEFTENELALELSALRCDRRAVKGLMSLLAKRKYKKKETYNYSI